MTQSSLTRSFSKPPDHQPAEHVSYRKAQAKSKKFGCNSYSLRQSPWQTQGDGLFLATVEENSIRRPSADKIRGPNWLDATPVGDGRWSRTLDARHAASGSGLAGITATRSQRTDADRHRSWCTPIADRNTRFDRWCSRQIGRGFARRRRPKVTKSACLRLVDFPSAAQSRNSKPESSGHVDPDSTVTHHQVIPRAMPKPR